MNAKTMLSVKLDKDLKKDAQETAKEIGVPLGTAITAFLKQFVRDKEITFSANKYYPSEYLQSVIKEAEDEYNAGKANTPLNEKQLISHLKNL